MNMDSVLSVIRQRYGDEFDFAAHEIYYWDPLREDAYIELYITPDGIITSSQTEGATAVTVPSFYPVPETELVPILKESLAKNMEILTREYIYFYVPHTRQINFTNAKQNAKFLLERTDLVSTAISDGKISDTLDTVIANVKSILANILQVEQWIAQVMTRHYQLLSSLESATTLEEIASVYKKLFSDYEAIVKPDALTTFTSRNLGYLENIYTIVLQYL